MTARSGATTKPSVREGGRRDAACTIAGSLAVAVVSVAAAVLLVVPYALGPDGRDGRLLVAVDAQAFPDSAWREYVSSTFDANGDGYLSFDETEGVTRIGSCDPSTGDVLDEGASNRGIRSFAGIERFPNLEMLVAQGNDIDSIDVTGNPRLRFADLRGNGGRFDVLYGDDQADMRVFVDGGSRVVSQPDAG